MEYSCNGGNALCGGMGGGWSNSLPESPQLEHTIVRIPIVQWIPEKPIKFALKKIIFSGPATIALWEDSTKTVVKCAEGDTYSKETGVALCYMKKALGNTGRYNNELKRAIKTAES